jgi:GntR family transcriptional regulator, transcriptional repressor for pyruvate dehydrogenase complex
MKHHHPFTTLAPPRRHRLSDSITQQIEQLIVEGTLTPGDPLPSERDLAKHLGVSRPSLREALLVLESRGLIQAKRGGGFGVTDITGPTITDPLVHLLQRHPETIDDVLELRHGLECVAAYFAAIRATDADAKRLKDMSAVMRRRRAERDPLEDADLDADFHMAIAEASHNVALVHVMRGIFNLMRSNMIRSREVLYRQAGNILLLDDQHTEIVKAIIARDHDAARAAANLHLSFIQTSLREIDPPVPRKRPATRARAKA